ncbi:unnamed protein product [Diplocarpon coronariae]
MIPARSSIQVPMMITASICIYVVCNIRPGVGIRAYVV